MTLHHVSLELRPEDAGADVRFWALLGFDEVPAPAGLQGEVRWVEREGKQIHLVHMDAPAIPRRGHAAIHAPDYEGTLGALRAAGHDPRPGPEYWGEPRAFVHSPAGHRVEVMSVPP